MTELAYPPPEIPYTFQRLPADDGVSLAVQSVGQGPAVLVANGIAITAPALDYLVGHLRDRYRVILWDYRGTGQSRLPTAYGDVSMQQHARDGLAVLRGLGVERAAVLGWSMGVPVALELLRNAPDRVTGLGALFGAAARPFRGKVPTLVSDAVLAGLLLSERAPSPLHWILRLGKAVPPLAWLVCSTIRFVGTHTPPAMFQRCVRNAADAERQAYLRMLAHLIEHDARDVLPLVRCPMLVVGGSDDWVVAPEACEETARLAPAARLVLLEATSHFGVMEHGPKLWEPLDELLELSFRPGRSG